MLLLVIFVGYLCFSWWSFRLSHSITEDAFVEAHIVNIGPQAVSGHLVRFLVQENDRVEKDQLFAEIDPVPYRDQVEVARKNVDVAQAELDRQAASLAEAQASVDAANADLVLAEQEYKRFTNLENENVVPLRRAQEVTQSRDTAQAHQKLAEAKLASAHAERTKIAQTVAEARAALTAAEDQLKFTQIRAPFPGVVVKVYRHLGDFASAGVPILSMYNPDLLYVTANLEETRLRGVAPGVPVELHIDAFDKPFRGRVLWINKSTGAEFALLPRNVVSGEFTWVVQRVPVRIAIEKDDRWPQLRAGLSVEAVIEHGVGDQEWADKATKEEAVLESQYNSPKE
jgi:membrane fusion protein, multidrug efflux system